ncbi:MAG: hypothetical protein ACLUEQ_04760 [Cloacibacillus evryensis]
MEKIAFAAKPAAASTKIKFYHLSCERGELPLAGETEAYFIPFRTATVFPFSFPFGRKVNLRNAVSLTFRPVLGEQSPSFRWCRRSRSSASTLLAARPGSSLKKRFQNMRNSWQKSIFFRLGRLCLRGRRQRPYRVA